MSQAINNCLTALNSIGRCFCEYSASMFIQSSVLIAFLLLIDFLIRKRVKATFRYWIWMLVFVKLILPPSLSLPTGVGYWSGSYLPDGSFVLERASEVVQQKLAGASPSEGFSASGEIPDVQPAEASSKPAVPANVAAPSLIAFTWQAVVFGLWLVGVLVVSVLLIQRILFVRGLVAQSEPAKNRLPDMLNQCRRQVGIAQNIELRLSNNMSCPAVCGLFKQVILIPTALLEELSPDRLRAVLIHELVHIKRADIWVNLVQTVLQIIYFYNPFVWLANVVVRRIREQAVDEMVLVALGSEAKSYSNTLIDIAEMACFRASLSVRLIGVAESRKSLERRIKHMLARPIPKSARIGVIGFVVLLAVSFVVLPMTAAETDEQKENNARFSATLPNGVTVEFVGVCTWPGEGRRCWRPDGLPLPEEIYAAKWNKSPGEGDYGFMLKVKGPKDLNFSWNEIQGAGGWEGSCKVVDGRGNQLEGFEAAISDMEKGQLTTRVRIGIAARPWTTIASHDGKRMNSGRQEGVLWSQAFEARDGTHIVASAEWRRDRAERVVAIDREGVLHTTGHGSVASGNVDQMTASFRNLKVSQIKEFQYQSRPYHWVAFNNVSLKPGVKTDVRIESVSTAPDVGLPDPLPNIFIMQPSRSTFSIFNEVVSLSQDWVWHKTGRQHNKKSYDEILIDGIYNRKDGDVLVLVFSLDRKDRIPTEYEGLLPKPWQEIEAELKQGKTVELAGKARGLNVILLAAPKMDQLKETIATSSYLNNPESFIKTSGEGCDVGIEDFKIDFDPDRIVYSAVVSIRNLGKVSSPKFVVKFYRSDQGQAKPMIHGAGPIKPGGLWNERSSSFGLKEGVNTIFVVLDPANLIEETDETNNRASMVIAIEDGNIIQKSASFELGIDKDTGSVVERPQAKSLRVYEVNRSVADFPDKEDLSTPEAACAAINRVSASGEDSGWVRVSVKKLADRLAREERSDKEKVDSEWARVLLNACILEVRIWKGKYAMVMMELPQELSSKKIRKPIDLRSLEFENGRWLNAGNARAWTVQEGRAIFAEACEYREEETKRELIRNQRIKEVMEHPEEIIEATEQLFEKIRNADYEHILSYYSDGKWKEDGWKKFPTLGYYMVHTDYPSFARWCCETFRANPIVSVELGEVSIGDEEILDRTGWPTVPYKLTLKDGTILAGELAFKYNFDGDKGHWHGMEGIDWHLQ